MNPFKNLHSEQTKYLNNFNWLVLDNVIKIIGGFLVAIWVQKYLSKSDYGVITNAIAYTGIFTVLANLGLGHIVIRDIVQFPKLKRFYLGTALGLKVVGAGIAFALINISAFYYEPDTLSRFVIFLFSFQLLANVFNTLNIYYDAKVKIKYHTIASAVSYLISSLIKVYLILNEYSVEYFAYAYIADYVISGILKIIFYQKLESDIFKWRFSRKLAKQILLDSWAVGLTVFLAQIYSNVDKIMINDMLNKEELGIYGVSTLFSDISGMLPPLLMASVLPYLVELKKNNPVFYERRFKQIMSLVTWGAIIVCALSVLFGDYMFSILYNGKYDDAYLPFAYNIWKLLFLAQTQLVSIWLLNQNLQRFQLYTNLFGAVSNIILNYFLITEYGIVGAALSTLISRVIINWGSPLLFKETREVTRISIGSLNPMVLVNYLRMR